MLRWVNYCGSGRDIYSVEGDNYCGTGRDIYIVLRWVKYCGSDRD